MNLDLKCSCCGRARCGLIYVNGTPFCDDCINKCVSGRDREMDELKAERDAMQRRAESAKADWQKDEKEIAKLKAQMGDTVAEQAYRITCLEEALDRQLRWLNLAAVQAEAIRAIWSPKPPSAEAKPDPIRAVYERFKHLDGLLCEINDEDEDFRKTAAALWLAVKAKVEGQPAGQPEQAKE